MQVNFEDAGALLVTFFADDSAKEGQVCTVTDNGTVGACEENGRFCGMVEHVGYGVAAVQLRGYVEAPYTGTAPTVGYCALAADGSGGVTATGENSYLVLRVDASAGTVGFLL